MEELNKAIDEVISCITESSEYKNCILLKKQMDSNEEIVELVDEIKKIQKDYIKSNYNNDLKKELDSKVKKLESIPIYNIYLNNLDVVNSKIDLVKDELNDYFYKLFNE